MTDIPDWVLFEAAKRGEWNYRADVDDKGLAELKNDYANYDPMFRALCDAIAKHEQQPPDRKLLIARQAASETAPKYIATGAEREGWLAGAYDDDYEVRAAVRAIELWEEGQ